MCDVNTEGKHDVRQNEGLEMILEKKSRLTRSIVIKLPVKLGKQW